MFSILFFLPVSVAGIFSVEQNSALNQVRAGSMWGLQNSQNVGLLSSPLNPDPNYSIGGAEIGIVDSSALKPERNPSATDASITEEKSDQIRVYVVRKGDSLSQIASMFDVSVKTIVWANDIDHGSLIKPGQRLIILPISGIRHTVQQGDTLASIAEEYNGKLKEIRQYNNLPEGSTLSVGEEIVIPHGEMPSPTPYTRAQYAAEGGSNPEEGYYLRPIRGGVISQGLHGFNAIDFATSWGQPILAAASGEVIISRDSGRWNGGYGNYVVIRHNNGTQTLYAHTSRNAVYVGQNVVKGQVIGYIGSTGRSTGPHVHFEVRGMRNPFAR